MKMSQFYKALLLVLLLHLASLDVHGIVGKPVKVVRRCGEDRGDGKGKRTCTITASLTITPPGKAPPGGDGNDKPPVDPGNDGGKPPVPTVPTVPPKGKGNSATAISSTIPAVLITSVVFIYLYKW
eukprot:Tbor_TRINITY_DN5969_c1_g4::TRINITY_DN5969_c1_g4_i2::g.18694::m.18694